MVCPGCATENRPGRRFCVGCGRSLAAACPRCGAATGAGERYCGECGAPLATSNPTTAAPADTTSTPVAERRLVSVLFADLVGFTPFAEERDAEDVRETLSRYFALAADIIGRYGGTVEKFIGDAVMAVWGTPTAHEDDAERAVRAGLELLVAIETIGPTMQARVGIVTGEAAVTLGATDQGMVAGDLVNSASRLQSVAAAGSVLVGETTMRAASSAITFEAAGEQALEGRTVPLAAWRALRVVAERGGRGRSGILEPPFVGRVEELRLLKDLVHTTSRERRPRLVSITGPAGIGKTRLAWELEKYAGGLAESITWLQGGSPAYGDGVTFWALGEMVRQRAGLAETDNEPTTREAVDRLVVNCAPDAEDRRWIEPAVLALLGLEPSPPGGRDVLFAGWRLLVERIAAGSAAVLVFEDLQWADSGLLDFIEQLLESARTAPILVVTLARPELFERRPSWGAARRNATAMALEPLAEPEMRELLVGLIPGLPAPTVAALAARAEGIPLYAVELVRMLAAQGRLSSAGLGRRTADVLTTLPVPESLAALVASRLDALDRADRILVGEAAVLGQTFTATALAAVSGVAEVDLDARLRAVVRREILRVEGDPRSPQRGQYAFVQALVREVAYGRLAKRDRQSLHLAAARFLEGMGSGELAGALAGHYLAAYRNAREGAEAEAVAAQACIALRAAAVRAAALGAHGQAITFCEQALTITHRPAEEAALHELAGASAVALERTDHAEAHFRVALDLRGALGDREMEVATIAAYASALLGGWRVDQALTLLDEASIRFADLGGHPALVRLNGQLARGHMIGDHLRDALKVADQVLEDAERLDLVDVVADTLVTRGSALAGLGRRHEGIGAIEAGRKLAVELGLPRTEMRATNNLATRLFEDNPRAGLDAARAGLALAHRIGEWHSGLMDNATACAFRTGAWDGALSELEPMLGEDLDPLTRSDLLSWLIQLHVLRGEPTATFTTELASLPASGDDWFVNLNRASSRMWTAFVEGRYDAARAESLNCQQALTSQNIGVDVVFALMGARSALLAGDAISAEHQLGQVAAPKGRAIDADRTTIRAGLAALAGCPQAALPLYREALRAWRDLGCAWDEALCALDMATLLEPGEPEVRTAAERASEILVRLRAQPLLRRLVAALAGPSRAEPPPTAPAVAVTSTAIR